jgi:hypothetical protein
MINYRLQPLSRVSPDGPKCLRIEKLCLHASQACEILTKLLHLLLRALVAFVADQPRQPRQLGAMRASPVAVTRSNCVASLQQMFLEPDHDFRMLKICVPL